MKKTILKIPEATYREISEYHEAHPKERITILTGTLVQRQNRTLILVSEAPIFLADDCYENTSKTYLKLVPDIATRLLQRFVDSHDDVLINIHHHPFSKEGATFSVVDDADDIRLDRLIREACESAGKNCMNVSIVFDRESFDARVIDSRSPNPFQSIDEIHCIGRERFYVRYPNSAKKPLSTVSDRSSRQDFLGEEQLERLRNMRIGICGAGGTGSIISEALTRLEVKELVLIDDDTVENSNLNRLQGIGHRDVGRKKVDVLRKHLRRITSNIRIKTVDSPISDPRAFNALSDCDVIFSAVDNSFARAILNQLSVQYLIPLFDVGVQVELNPTNFLYRTFNVFPGTSACMVCSKFEMIDAEKVHHASLSKELEAEYRTRGYITDIEEETAPSVYPLNLMAVGELMTGFLNYLCQFRDMTVLRYGNFQERLLHTTEQNDYPDNLPAEDCPVCSVYLGKGDDLPVPYLQHNADEQKETQQLIAENIDELWANGN